MGTKAYLGDLDAELLGAQESYGFTRTRHSMWVKNCHKPPIFLGMVTIPPIYKNGDDWGMVQMTSRVTHIVGSFHNMSLCNIAMWSPPAEQCSKMFKTLRRPESRNWLVENGIPRPWIAVIPNIYIWGSEVPYGHQPGFRIHSPIVH